VGGRDDEPVVRRMRLMAEHDAFPLWADPHEGTWGDPWRGESPEDLPLSPSLVAALWAWTEQYGQLERRQFRWTSRDGRRAFLVEGRRLLRRLQQELGPGYEIVLVEPL
jgi:hypothetical protein